MMSLSTANDLCPGLMVPNEVMIKTLSEPVVTVGEIQGVDVKFRGNHIRCRFLVMDKDIPTILGFQDVMRGCTDLEELFLYSYKEVIQEEEALPLAEVPPHDIVLQDEEPISLPLRRIPQSYMEEIKRQIEQMEEDGIISRANPTSLWGFPMVIVPKRNGELRICIDFRLLNQKTVPDSYPIPNIKELLSYI